ncbi:MAG TPA: hypothetical protein VGI95_19315 [Caulobacteraceae bacterium]
MNRLSFAAALGAALLVGASAIAETLTDDSIVQLERAGLGPDAIVAKIRTTDSRFDVSTNALVALKRDGLPDPVIAAMVNAFAVGGAPARFAGGADLSDPMAPHAGGIYMAEAGPPGMQILDPTIADDSKSTSALAWFFSHGAAPLKITTILDGPAARFGSDAPRPAFYFYFNQPGSGLYKNGLGVLRMPGPAPSPALFTLIHFDVVGGNREALIQQLGAGGDQSGGVGRARVTFNFAEVSPGVFKVTPDSPLEPGQYAFVYTPSDAQEGEDAEARYFEFAITPGAAEP